MCFPAGHPACLCCCLDRTSIRDIKKLDYAKKHLTATITALRRLSMLINAVGAAAAGAFA